MTQTVEPMTPAERASEMRVTVERYHQLIEAGLLTPDDRVELLENRIVTKMSKNPPHAYCKRKLLTLFDRLLPAGWFYLTEDPITLADSEPEPDGAVVAGTVEDYADRHPGPAATVMVIEVADSSLSRDRGVKLRSYARAGIATVWIVNLVDRTVEVYTTPQPTTAEPAYAGRQDYTETDAAPVTVGGAAVGTIAVRDVLP